MQKGSLTVVVILNWQQFLTQIRKRKEPEKGERKGKEFSASSTDENHQERRGKALSRRDRSDRAGKRRNERPRRGDRIRQNSHSGNITAHAQIRVCLVGRLSSRTISPNDGLTGQRRFFTVALTGQ